MPSQEVVDKIFKRIVALDRIPVPESFTIETLRMIHNFLFQDAKEEFHPGKYRDPVMKGHDWVKYRRLETCAIEPVSVYSRMDDLARADAGNALLRASENFSRAETTKEVAEILSDLYVELDFLHPFHDGNSRSIRSFTRLMARAHGWHVAWEDLSPTGAGRDKLYIARDKAVGALALERMEIHEDLVKKEIGWFQEEAGIYEGLEEIMTYIVKPLPGAAQTQNLKPAASLS